MEPSGMATLVGLLAIVALVAANGLFVASEFAIVSVRRTRLIPLIARGSKTAQRVMRAAEKPDPLIAATQLGITMASLGLGWIGEPALARSLEPALEWIPGGWQQASSHVVAGTIAFAIITTLHIVFGELAPKSIALWRAEPTALVVVPPTELFYRVFKPFIWLLNTTANATLSLFGLRAPSGGRHVYSAEEIGLLIAEGHRAGTVEEEEARLAHRVFKFQDRLAEEVMVPRVRVRGIPDDGTVGDAIQEVREAGYTRLPVFHADLDHIVGMVHAKDLLFASADARAAEPVQVVMRKVLYVPETKPVVDLLAEMQRQGIQLAAIVDEFGGTSGIVTIEDLLEELVGEIPGELRPERRLVAVQTPDRIVVEAGISIETLNEIFQIGLPTGHGNTLGGFVFYHLETIPDAGTTFHYDALEFKIESVTAGRIGLIQIRKKTQA